jgi:hypothetical protein
MRARYLLSLGDNECAFVTGVPSAPAGAFGIGLSLFDTVVRLIGLLYRTFGKETRQCFKTSQCFLDFPSGFYPVLFDAVFYLFQSARNDLGDCFSKLLAFDHAAK